MATMRKKLGVEWEDFKNDLPGNLQIAFVVSAIGFVFGWITVDVERGAIYFAGGLLISFVGAPLTWARYDRDERENQGFKLTAIVLTVCLLASAALMTLLLLPLMLID